MRREPAERSDALPGPAIDELQKGHFGIDIAGIPRSLVGWIEEVSTWTPVYSCVLYFPYKSTCFQFNYHPQLLFIWTRDRHALIHIFLGPDRENSSLNRTRVYLPYPNKSLGLGSSRPIWPFFFFNFNF